MFMCDNEVTQCVKDEVCDNQSVCNGVFSHTQNHVTKLCVKDDVCQSCDVKDDG